MKWKAVKNGLPKLDALDETFLQAKQLYINHLFGDPTLRGTKLFVDGNELSRGCR